MSFAIFPCYVIYSFSAIEYFLGLSTDEKKGVLQKKNIFFHFD